MGSLDSSFELTGETAPAYVEKKYMEIKWELFQSLVVFFIFCAVLFFVIDVANPYTEGSTKITPAKTGIPDIAVTNTTALAAAEAAAWRKDMVKFCLK